MLSNVHLFFFNSIVKLCKKVGKIDTYKIAQNQLLEKTGKANVSKFKFMHTLSKSKSILAIE